METIAYYYAIYYLLIYYCYLQMHKLIFLFFIANLLKLVTYEVSFFGCFFTKLFDYFCVFNNTTCLFSFFICIYYSFLYLFTTPCLCFRTYFVNPFTFFVFIIIIYSIKIIPFFVDKVKFLWWEKLHSPCLISFLPIGKNPITLFTPTAFRHYFMVA